MKIFEVTSTIAAKQAALAPQATTDTEASSQPQTPKKGSVEELLVQQGSLPKMGAYLRDQYDMKGKRGKRIKSTGSTEVDDLLTRMGFIVK